MSSVPTYPGVFINTLDLSAYSEAVTGNPVVIIGCATRGPFGTPITVKTVAEIYATFGLPLAADPAIRSAALILQAGGLVTFVRVASGTPTATTFTLATESGGSAGTAATGSITLASVPADGDTVVIGDGALSVTFEFDSNSTVTGGRTAVAIGATAAITAANLSTAINATALTVTASNTAGSTVVNLVADSVGISHNVTITKTGTATTLVGMVGGVNYVAPTTTNVATLTASSPGTWGNSLAIVVAATKFANATPSGFDLTVMAPVDYAGTLGVVETYSNLTLDPTNERYLLNVLNTGIIGAPASAFVTATVIGTPAVAPIHAATLSAATQGSNGSDTTLPADYIGTVNGTTATGLRSLRNRGLYPFTTLLVPGVSDSTVIAACTDFAAKRGDIVYLADAPRGLSTSQILDWHNGKSAIVGAPATALDSSFVGVYYWWMKVIDPVLGVACWMPPSAIAAAAFGRVDGTKDEFHAVAGLRNGVVNFGTCEFSPDEDDQALLQGNGNKINPIIYFQGTGPVIYGNNTTQRKPTGLDSMSVRRALNAAIQLTRQATQIFPFSVSNSATWDSFKLAVNPILSRIKTGDGFANFAIEIGASNNPSDIRAQKRMRARIVVEYTPTAEKLEIDFALVGPGNTYFG